MEISRSMVICGTALVLLMLIALGAPLLAPHDPLAHHPQARFQPPGTRPFLLGTDNHGRDVLSRLLFGARSTLVTAGIAVSIAGSIGITIGVLAASIRRIEPLMVVVIHVLLSFPLVLLVLILLFVLDFSPYSVAIALGVGFIPVFARHFRLEAHAMLQRNFVLSAITIGASRLYIIRKHLIPNLFPHIVMHVSLNMVLIISIATALSFLGFGASPPDADWGLMLRDARAYLHVAPWMALLPGGGILVLNLLFQYFAELIAKGMGTG